MWLVSFLRNHFLEETIRILRKLAYYLGVIRLAVKAPLGRNERRTAATNYVQGCLCLANGSQSSQ